MKSKILKGKKSFWQVFWGKGRMRKRSNVKAKGEIKRERVRRLTDRLEFRRGESMLGKEKNGIFGDRIGLSSPQIHNKKKNLSFDGFPPLSFLLLLFFGIQLCGGKNRKVFWHFLPPFAVALSKEGAEGGKGGEGERRWRPFCLASSHHTHLSAARHISRFSVCHSSAARLSLSFFLPFPFPRFSPTLPPLCAS